MQTLQIAAHPRRGRDDSEVVAAVKLHELTGTCSSTCMVSMVGKSHRELDADYTHAHKRTHCTHTGKHNSHTWKHRQCSGCQGAAQLQRQRGETMTERVGGSSTALLCSPTTQQVFTLITTSFDVLS